jgi:hypothetical protein
MAHVENQEKIRFHKDTSDADFCMDNGSIPQHPQTKAADGG